MNKAEVLKALQEKTNLDEGKCAIINDVLENNFLVGKKNKEKITAELAEKLSVTLEEADNIYNKAMDVIGTGIKDAIKHPFKSKD